MQKNVQEKKTNKSMSTSAKVMIGAGAKVLGPITIGKNAKVAAGAVVVKDVEPNCTVVGVPGEVVRIDGERVDDLDQINIPDPIMNAITENQKKIKELEDKIKILEDLKNENIQHDDQN